MPWPEKTFSEILTRLETMDLKLDELRGESPKPTVTKKQLMEIDGVGSATADKILELLK